MGDEDRERNALRNKGMMESEDNFDRTRMEMGGSRMQGSDENQPLADLGQSGHRCHDSDSEIDEWRRVGQWDSHGRGSWGPPPVGHAYVMGRKETIRVR